MSTHTQDTFVEGYRAAFEIVVRSLDAAAAKYRRAGLVLLANAMKDHADVFRGEARGQANP